MTNRIHPKKRFTACALSTEAYAVLTPACYCYVGNLAAYYAEFKLGMLNSFFLKLEVRWLKFELNSNFIYILDPQQQQISFALYSRQHYYTSYTISSYLFTDLVLNIIKYSSLCIYIEQQVKTPI